MRIPVLKVLAPTQSEPPFFGTQVVVMVVFISPRDSCGQALSGGSRPRGLGVHIRFEDWCILLVRRSINYSIPRDVDIGNLDFKERFHRRGEP